MKIICLVLLVIILNFTLSCKKNEGVPYEGIAFLFDKMQTFDEREIASFPNRFTGNYINSDSTCLVVGKKDIFI